MALSKDLVEAGLDAGKARIAYVEAKIKYLKLCMRDSPSVHGFVALAESYTELNEEKAMLALFEPILNSFTEPVQEQGL